MLFITSWVMDLIALPFVFYGIMLALFFVVAMCIDGKRDEVDGDGWFLSTLASVGLLWMIGYKMGITLADIKAMPSSLFIGLVSYLVVGVLWSFGKWYFLLSNVREAYKEFKSSWVTRNKVNSDFLTDTSTSDVVIENFVKALNESSLTNYKYTRADQCIINRALIVQSIIPQANSHKSRITQWIAFWPMSSVWTLLNDPLRKIVNQIFSRIKSVFQRMSEAMFAGV